jgi:hypothetical protein
MDGIPLRGRDGPADRASTPHSTALNRNHAGAHATPTSGRGSPARSREPAPGRQSSALASPRGGTRTGSSVPLSSGELDQSTRAESAGSAEPPLAGRLSRLRWVTRGMITRACRSSSTWIPWACPAREVRGFCEPAEAPQAGGTAADPRKNVTGGTAHSGTLVVRVKGAENRPWSALTRVSWAVGALPGKCSQGDRTGRRNLMTRSAGPAARSS